MTATESQVFDLVVVSAYGRGNWAAMELANRGWKVVLADVTDQLGQLAPEDSEGPFGLLEAQDLLPSQRARLADEGELESVAPGFTMWLPEGPLEFRSELTPFLLRAREVPETVEGYLRRTAGKSSDADRERKAVSKLAYNRNWLAQFAHIIHSTVNLQNHVAVESGAASPLFSAFSIRQVTEAGPSKGIKLCQTAGVTVRQKSRVKDVRFDGNLVDAVEFDDERAGAERTRAVLWCLSPQETKSVSENMFKILFPHDAPAPEWSWERIRFRSDSKQFDSSLPVWSALIHDRDLSWTRANIVVLRRIKGGNMLDAWVKVPAWMRSDRSAFEAIRREVEVLLRERMPDTELVPVLADFAPFMWPVYNKEELESFKSVKSSNFFFSSAEFWSGLDWLGRFRHEQKVVTQLEKLKSQWDAAALKAAAKAAAKAEKEASQ